MSLAAVALLLFSCAGPTETKPKEEAKPAASSCDVSMETLAGTAWVHMKPQASGPEKPSAVTRIRFRDEGGKMVADYTASSLSAVYQYDCTKQFSLLPCM